MKNGNNNEGNESLNRLSASSTFRTWAQTLACISSRGRVSIAFRLHPRFGRYHCNQDVADQWISLNRLSASSTFRTMANKSGTFKTPIMSQSPFGFIHVSDLIIRETSDKVFGRLNRLSASSTFRTRDRDREGYYYGPRVSIAFRLHPRFGQIGLSRST